MSQWGREGSQYVLMTAALGDDGRCTSKVSHPSGGGVEALLHQLLSVVAEGFAGDWGGGGRSRLGTPDFPCMWGLWVLRGYSRGCMGSVTGTNA